jgi:AraC-like DNA-binding protein
MMQKQIDASKAECGDEFESQVMRLLRTAVLTGECSADRVADAFAMDARTLRRRLSETGTSFRILQQQCRLEIARQFLETSDMDVATIAEALHYANSSAFARAFRSWSGMAPRSAPASRRHAEVR